MKDQNNIVILTCYSTTPSGSELHRRHIYEDFSLAHHIACQNGVDRVIFGSIFNNPDFVWARTPFIDGFVADPNEDINEDWLRSGILPDQRTFFDLSEATAVFVSFEGDPEHLALVADLKRRFPDTLFVNDTDGILAFDDKYNQQQFTKHCNPTRAINSRADIEAELQSGLPVIFKPRLSGYGGIGVIKVSDGRVDVAGEDSWLLNEDGQRKLMRMLLPSKDNRYIAQGFLNPATGEKRIFVTGGVVTSAYIYNLKEGAWQTTRGTTKSKEPADLTREEWEMVRDINAHARKLGVIDYVVDTMGDATGRRKLLEINTMCAGGIGFYDFSDPSANKIRAKIITDYIFNTLGIVRPERTPATSRLRRATAPGF